MTRPRAVVTGGAKRVGGAIVRALASAGCDVAIVFHQSEREANALAAEVRAGGADAAPFRCDLSDLHAVEALGGVLVSNFPRIDVLVHNASEYGETPIGSIEPKDVIRHYSVNAASPLLLSQALAPRLRESPLPGGGAIVALADIHALGRPREDFAAYSMSKAALIEMVRVLARALAPRVRVNAVAPGVVAWPESGPETDPQLEQRYLERVPLARAGTAADAAEAVRWLALEAHYVTGEVLRVDGGRWLA